MNINMLNMELVKALGIKDDIEAITEVIVTIRPNELPVAHIKRLVRGDEELFTRLEVLVLRAEESADV